MTSFNMRGIPGFVALVVMVVVAAGSGAAAGSLITSADIKDNTVKARDIRNGTISTADIHDGSIGKADLDPSLLSELGLSNNGTPGGGGTTTTPEGDTTPPPVPAVHPLPNGYIGGEIISWEPVVAADLAGYNVYESVDKGVTWTKLTPTPISTTTFDASAGHADGFPIHHAVTSVDTAGNESARSANVSFNCALAVTFCTKAV